MATEEVEYGKNVQSLTSVHRRTRDGRKPRVQEHQTWYQETAGEARGARGRFQSAADEVIDNLEQMEERLEEKLNAVEAIADQAASSARAAIRVAESATDAAQEAAAAAEDAAHGGERYGF